MLYSYISVSYTHLDVYKRQPLYGSNDRRPCEGNFKAEKISNCLTIRKSYSLNLVTMIYNKFSQTASFLSIGSNLQQ